MKRIQEDLPQEKADNPVEPDMLLKAHKKGLMQQLFPAFDELQG